MTTTEPDVTRPESASELTEQAQALADAQPPVEVGELVHLDRVEPSEAERANAAIVAASEAALAMPGIAGKDEFLSLAMQARILSMSGAAPKAIRDNPHLAFHVAMVGRDLGISPSASVELIDIIPGKRDQSTNEVEYRLSLSPQLLNGQVRRLGLGSIVKAYTDDLRCVAWAVGPGGLDRHCAKHLPDHEPDCSCDVIGTSEFTWEHARRADLVGPNCAPGDHTKDQDRGSGSRTWKVCGCNQGYITYPERMLWWRAAGFCADDWFSEASLGLYSPEALGALVDDDGRAIDPATVALPDGYEPAELPPAKAPGTNPNEPAPQDFREQCKERIYRLPHPAIETLREQWSRQQDDGQPMIFPLPVLPLRQVKAASAIIAGFEKRAERGEWGPWAPDPLSWETPEPAQAGPLGGVEAPAGAPDAPGEPETSTGPQGAPPEAVPDAPGPVQPELLPDAPPYDPKNPPSEILEAAIDRAGGIADDLLDDELAAVGQTVIANHKPDTKRKRLVQVWFRDGWTPEAE